MSESKCVFISYSWDSPEHKRWVKTLSDRLKEAGISTILDQDDLVLGDPIPKFMEDSIKNSDYVLFVCTPRYKEKADNRTGGVGYEESIIAADIYEKMNHRKYIPVLASGSWGKSTPTWARGKFGVDFSTPENYENDLPKLLRTINPVPPAPQRKTPDSEEIKTIVQEGDRLFNSRNYLAAMTKYQKAIALDPDNAEYHYSLSLTLRAMHQTKEAKQERQRAHELAPDNPRYK